MPSGTGLTSVEGLDTLIDSFCEIALLYSAAVSESLYQDILAAFGQENEVGDEADFLRAYFAEMMPMIYCFYFSNLALLNPTLDTQVGSELNTLANSARIQTGGIERTMNGPPTVKKVLDDAWDLSWNVINTMSGGCAGGCAGGCCGIEEPEEPDEPGDPKPKPDPIIPDPDPPLTLSTDENTWPVGVNGLEWKVSSRIARSPDIAVACDIGWEVSIPAPAQSWLSKGDPSGFLPGLLKQNSFALYAEPNDTGAARTAVVTVKTTGALPSTQQITVTQKARYDLGALFTQIANNVNPPQGVPAKYNHELATFAMHLSYAAYNPVPIGGIAYIRFVFSECEIERIDKLLMGDDRGTPNNPADDIPGYAFENIDYHLEEYAQTFMSSVGYVIAHKTITVNGVNRSLVVVPFRGTSHAAGWPTNLASFVQREETGFLGAANDAGVFLAKYIQDYSLTNPIVLLTGHSKGAAVANVLADKLNTGGVAGVNASDVYAYTFATVNVKTNVDTSYENIFNILNKEDGFTYGFLGKESALCPGNWGRHGLNARVEMDYPAKRNTTDSHEMPTYMRWMERTTGLGVSFWRDPEIISP